MITRTIKKRGTALALAVGMSLGAVSLGAARPAQAGSEDTWRYVTYGAGAATVYFGAKKKWLPAAVGAAGTYLAYKQWDKEKDKRRRRERGYDRRDRRR